MGAAYADGQTLLLFDIDGTLLGRASSEHAQSLRAALHEVHGLHPEFTADLDAAGRTDGEIARRLLLAAGYDAATIDARATDVRTACVADYANRCPADLSDKVLPGVSDLLDQLGARDDVVLSLVTGNFEPVARLKLGHAGIGRWFASGQGGFGSDSEDRTDLPAIARRRAGAAAGSSVDAGIPFPRERTIVIGDTPRDIACAQADGVRCVAVTTGQFGRGELSQADAVAGPGELAGALASLGVET